VARWRQQLGGVSGRAVAAHSATAAAAVQSLIETGQKIRSGSVLDGLAPDGLTRDVGLGCRDGLVGSGWLGWIDTAWRTYKIVQVGCLV